MLFPRVDDDTLYAALLARDPAYEGRAFVGVTSTGILCRLTCVARKPKRANCRFFERVAEGLEAGFRPCKRCRPLAPPGEADPVLRELTEALEADPSRRWTEADVVALGHDPSTVRRAFKRHYGLTFLELARLTRLRGGLQTLAEGGKVVEAQLDAGFDSPSGFRAAFARWLGSAPAAFTGREQLLADALDTPLGTMIAVSDPTHLHLLEFADRRALPAELRRLRAEAGPIGLGRHPPTDRIEAELGRYFRAEDASFGTPLALHGTPFTRRVWRALQAIPPGVTRSYAELAEAVGKPTATRAVARANGANSIAIVIPCHRVIGADGTLTGYGGGLWRKKVLIELEQKLGPGGGRER